MCMKHTVEDVQNGSPSGISPSNQQRALVRISSSHPFPPSLPGGPATMSQHISQSWFYVQNPRVLQNNDMASSHGAHSSRTMQKNTKTGDVIASYYGTGGVLELQVTESQWFGILMHPDIEALPYLEADSEKSVVEAPEVIVTQDVQMSETMNDDTKLVACVPVLQGIQTDALSECISQACHSCLKRLQGMLQIELSAPKQIQTMATELHVFKAALQDAGFDPYMPGQVKEAVIELHIKESHIVMQYASINLWSFCTIK
ncbi:uncharacterized protein LAESUDRAFT_715603 [Laetiporus sulphureus 93-53]|uniref:Uncharacterized protein n=1 Tax=Laetiporus sulphureus 93-53 TaxID=1314785 RepID=A0A165D6S4_9APHY|nr:uncharacterized protein LAESUDRAFT_715603 [Laetiporus sulphureus 93-53]KZT04257.1 hypothetical protein LAESUDRAFT_715603 [Laetiporus sulphureus 93-53]